MAVTVIRIPNLGGFSGVPSRYAYRFERGLKRAADMLFTRSQDLVPVDTKALSDSGRSYKLAGYGFSSVFVVGYGGDQKTGKYAVFVHEDLQKAHGLAYNVKHASDIAAGITHMRRPEEMAKFLEFALRSEHGRMVSAIAAEMRKP